MKFLSQINVNTEYTLPIVDGNNGQVLTTDGSGAVYWGSISMGAINLDGLTDVIITSPQINQILAYTIPLGESLPVWRNITSPYATIASPTFTGIPAAPTAPTATNTTQIATTAFVKAQGYITSAEATNLYVPYDGAIADVDLGENTLLSRNIVVNHASGSGVAVSITKGGNGEALTVVKSSGSGNAASITGGVTLLTTLHLTNRLADDYISSAVNWNTAYNDRITAASVSGTGTKTLTLTQGDGGTVTATWVDYDTDTDAQTLTWTKATSSISISNGNSVTLEGLATEEYVTSQGYITSYTETDTLNSVTGRGNTTTNGISVGSLTVPSFIYLSNAGANNAFISESWGVNLNGITTHPVQVRGASFSVGYSLGGGTNYGTNNLYVAGNVGFGTDSPTQRLDVNGNISLGSWTKAGNTYVGLRRADDGTFGNGGDSGLVIESYGHAAPYNGNYSQKVHLRTHLYNGGSHDVITGYGLNVGIGRSTPLYKLDVAGNARFDNELYVGGVWSTNYGPRTSNSHINFTDWNANTIARINTSSGIASVGNRKLSMGILDINSQGTPEVRINTKIPFALGGADFTVNIKGFQYGSSNMVSLSIGWHYYLSQFYNETAISNGAFAPTITLGVDENNLVVIHLSNVGYWPKLYVESVYSSAYADDYISNWSWADAGIDGLSNTAIVPYKPLDTSITGNAAYASSAGNSSTTSQTNFSTLTVSNNTVATQAWVTSQGYATSFSETDTLATVTGRGATTSTPITITGTEGREVAVYMPSSYGIDDLVSGHEYGWYSDHWRLGMTRSGAQPGADFVVQWNGARRLSLTNGGNLTVTGTVAATGGNSTNWNTAYGWGNHAGLYLPLSGGTISGNLNVSGQLAFPDGGGNYTNIIRSVGYPSEGYPSEFKYWLEYRAFGGHHFVLNVDGGVGSGENAMDDFIVWQGAIDGDRLLELTNAGNLTIRGTFTEQSSKRFKENIKNLEPTLSKVEQLNPVTYNKIGVVEEEIGLIAEEVAELFPEVVTYNEEGLVSGVQYQRLSVILLKAMQEQNAVIAALTERVNKLENK
jgi:hypothetical protein